MHGIGRDTMIDGRYRVAHRLGSGGMAEVWCAQDEQLGRRVALKLLAGRFAEDDAFRERFRREAQAAAGLQHPNVVGVYDRGGYDGARGRVTEMRREQHDQGTEALATGVEQVSRRLVD